MTNGFNQKDNPNNQNIESFQLEGGKVIPISHISLPFSIFGGHYSNIHKALSEHGINTHEEGYFYRCLSKSKNNGFSEYREKLKESGVDRPVTDMNDLQLQWNNAELTYFYMGEVKRSPQDNVSVILKFDPRAIIPSGLNDDLVSIGNKFYALFDHMFKNDQEHVSEALMKSLESVTEIQWT